MTLPVATSLHLSDALERILQQSEATKTTSQNYVAQLAAGPVSSDWVFAFINRCNLSIVGFNQYKGVPGLNAYAQAQIPGYAGTMTSDIDAVIAGIQACIDWVVANFPKDSTNTWVLAYSINADGTRNPRNFSTAQTAGLRTNLNALIALIG